MRSKLWIGGYFIILALILGIVGISIYDVDPYFHYRKPDTDRYYYSLDNQRSQNNGICRHFDYDALITGSSMTENFCTSEMDALFGTNSIKIPFNGGSYQEINNHLKNALKYNPSLKIIVRGLDMIRFVDPADTIYFNPSLYPTYLYDEDPLNDVRYFFNKSIYFNRIYTMKKSTKEDNFKPGITSFDSYSNWQNSFSCGINAINPKGLHTGAPEKEIHLTEEEKSIMNENIFLNITSLAEEYPDVTFYYFFTPYSAVWWAGLAQSGQIYRQIEAEQYLIEKILEHDNIKLFAFNMRTDITTDLNNYIDPSHYGQWINSLILKWMHEGEYRLTRNNYRQYIEDELAFYTSYDYENLSVQDDYEADLYAAALLNQELTGAEPIILNRYFSGGGTFFVTNADNHKYLTFYAKKNSDHGNLTVYVYDSLTEETTVSLAKNSEELDKEWHQYVLDISQAGKSFTIVMNSGNADSTCDSDSSCIFRDFIFY